MNLQVTRLWCMNDHELGKIAFPTTWVHWISAAWVLLEGITTIGLYITVYRSANTSTCGWHFIRDINLQRPIYIRPCHTSAAYRPTHEKQMTFNAWKTNDVDKDRKNDPHKQIWNRWCWFTQTAFPLKGPDTRAPHKPTYDERMSFFSIRWYPPKMRSIYACLILGLDAHH